MSSIVHHFCIVHVGASSGNSPGFGVALVAETTSGCLISSEACAASRGSRARGGNAQIEQELGDGETEDDLLSTGGQQGPGEDARQNEALIVPEDVGRVAAEVGHDAVRCEHGV